MSLTSILYTARDALAAQSFGLEVTGQNVANQSVEGYTRRSAVLSTRPLGTETAGTVQIDGIRRAADQYTERRLFEASSNTASAEERNLQLSNVEGLFNDLAGTGLGTSLGDLYGSFDLLAATPNDPTVRRTVLEAAENFANDANRSASSLAEQRTDLLDKATKVTGEINRLAEDIAKTSSQIYKAETLGKDAADLKDQRTQLLTSLSQKVDVRTVTTAEGELLVRSAGITLVEGGRANSLSIDMDASGNLVLDATKTSGPATDVTRFLSGGELAGIFEARDTDLVAVMNNLDNLVYEVATSVNGQHAAGFGLDGVTGRDLFTVNATPADAARTLQVDAAVLGNPDAIAAAGSALEVPGGSTNAVNLAALAEQPIAGLGNLKPANAYAELVGDVGLRKATAQQDVEVRGAIESQVKTVRESISGVSLDEELVALTTYQRAYQAASKVLTTADELLAELMNRVG